MNPSVMETLQGVIQQSVEVVRAALRETETKVQNALQAALQENEAHVHNTLQEAQDKIDARIRN